MPVHKCGSSALCLHELGGIKEDESGDYEYVEVDPGGRYGRYKEVLGKGAFKTVYRAFDQEDGIEVAWNQVRDVLLQTPEDLDRLYSEVHLLSTLKHKNIIKLHHSWIDEKSNTVNFITEIFTSGTLRQYRKRHKHIDIKAVKNWSRQILRGLLYLHSHDPPIIHRDLKCDNIFINGNQGEVKIGDLGLAAILQHAHARSVIGTPEFMAPELYEEEYTELVDVYSFGMCLLEMVTSEYPYSECTNAAQIYKKVMLGKKPEALKQIKDPELCQFVEKCLAPASKRLPARELLMDPFLQPEGSRGSLEPSSHLGRMIRMANDMDVKVVDVDESHGVSATVEISYVLKETLPAYVHDYVDACACIALDSKSSQTSDSKAAQNMDPSYFNHHKEERARSVDFRVNGKLREDDNVFLKLQISGSEGQVRNIHFPFDVESDTAMCVASEMVAELDLTDQDVTKIAEMIDAAILALIPEWKPGVAIDDGEGFDNEGEGSVGHCDPSANMPSEGLIEESSSYLVREETVSPSRLEGGVIYGRFEEVTYHCHRPEVPAQEAEKCSASSDTTDTDWSMTDSTSSHESQTLLPMSKEDFDEFSNVIDTREPNDSHGLVTISEFVESKRKSGCANFVHKIWERVVVHPCDLDNGGGVTVFGGQSVQPECCQQDIDTQGISSKVAIVSSNFDVDADCDEATQELADLDRRYRQEMQELQQKHEAARAEIRNRWRQKKQHYLQSNCGWDNGNSVLGSSENGFHSLRMDDSLCGSQRTLPYDSVSFNSSMASFDDLSSFGQETPRSPCKDSGDLISAAETVYFPLAVGGRNCSSETGDDAQEYLVNTAT